MAPITRLENIPVSKVILSFLWKPVSVQLTACCPPQLLFNTRRSTSVVQLDSRTCAVRPA
ncbi:hypothetical protein [Paraburkholderia acidipaludis]|uniref:hypothetical protein n=1 Tax=Paraburkholderia acidipaludis TaxID=660537 RepID=UPI00146FB41E|nr:hypothetical protein [Paraburkholderia acidipaludis]